MSATSMSGSSVVSSTVPLSASPKSTTKANNTSPQTQIKDLHNALAERYQARFSIINTKPFKKDIQLIEQELTSPSEKSTLFHSKKQIDSLCIAINQLKSIIKLDSALRQLIGMCIGAHVLGIISQCEGFTTPEVTDLHEKVNDLYREKVINLITSARLHSSKFPRLPDPIP